MFDFASNFGSFLLESFYGNGHVYRSLAMLPGAEHKRKRAGELTGQLFLKMQTVIPSNPPAQWSGRITLKFGGA